MGVTLKNVQGLIRVLSKDIVKTAIDNLPDNTIVGEVPQGIQDGINDTFTLNHPPSIGTEAVMVNGLRGKINNDYTLSGNILTFLIPPLLDDIILVDYNF